MEAMLADYRQERHDLYLLEERVSNPSGDTFGNLAELSCGKPLLLITEKEDPNREVQLGRLGVTDVFSRHHCSPAFMRRVLTYAHDRFFLSEKLHHQATHDELTALFNRKFIMEQLGVHISGARRHQYPFSVCLCNLDDFKRANHEYGHDIGDRVLTSFAELLKREIRSEDIAARYAGDEFCILFPHVTVDQARISVDRIQRSWSQQEFTSEEGRTFQVTASFGLAQWHQETVSPHALISEADQALYKAKSRGKNQWAMFEE